MKVETSNPTIAIKEREKKETKSFSLKRFCSKLVTTERIISVVSVAVVFLLWGIVTSLQLVNPLFLPSPSAVWASFMEILQNGYKGNTLSTHIIDSMIRLFSALALALVTAIPIGLLSGYSTKIRAILDPFIEFYRPLPPLAYYTLLVIWLGIENESKIVLLYLAAFAPIYIAAVSSVKIIPTDRINGALSLGASKVKLFTHVIFPSCLPSLFTGLRTAMGFTYTTLVASEMVASTSGIGWMVLDASKFLQSDVIFVAIIIMGVIAMILDGILRYIEYRLVPWKSHG